MALSLKQLTQVPILSKDTRHRDKINSKPWGDFNQDKVLSVKDEDISPKENFMPKRTIKHKLITELNDPTSKQSECNDSFFEERFVFKRNALGPGARALWCEVLNV